MTISLARNTCIAALWAIVQIILHTDHKELGLPHYECYIYVGLHVWPHDSLDPHLVHGNSTSLRHPEWHNVTETRTLCYFSPAKWGWFWENDSQNNFQLSTTNHLNRTFIEMFLSLGSAGQPINIGSCDGLVPLVRSHGMEMCRTNVYDGLQNEQRSCLCKFSHLLWVNEESTNVRC